MKWLISSCILIAFLVGIICTESKENDCTEQYANASLREESCFRRSHYDTTEFPEELRSAIVQYSGNDEAVYAFTNKYCPILRQTFECLNIHLDVDVDCLFPLAKEKNQQNIDILNAVLNYVCTNNTEVIIRFLKHSGIDSVYLNKHFDECVRLVGRVRYTVDEETLGPTTELCDGVDRGFACYADLTRDHANQDLAIIGNELRVVFRQAYKC